MLAAILKPNIHGRHVGLRVSYTQIKSSITSSAALESNNEELYLISMNVGTAKALINTLEYYLEWANTDYYNWAKRKTK